MGDLRGVPSGSRAIPSSRKAGGTAHDTVPSCPLTSADRPRHQGRGGSEAAHLFSCDKMTREGKVPMETTEPAHGRNTRVAQGGLQAKRCSLSSWE